MYNNCCCLLLEAWACIWLVTIPRTLLTTATFACRSWTCYWSLLHPLQNQKRNFGEQDQLPSNCVHCSGRFVSTLLSLFSHNYAVCVACVYVICKGLGRWQSCDISCPLDFRFVYLVGSTILATQIPEFLATRWCNLQPNGDLSEPLYLSQEFHSSLTLNWTTDQQIASSVYLRKPLLLSSPCPMFHMPSTTVVQEKRLRMSHWLIDWRGRSNWAVNLANY
jgi:hypothetical protein